MKMGEHPIEVIFPPVYVGPKTHRVVMEFPLEHYAKLEELMEEAGIESFQELIDYAVTLLEYSLEERKAQCEIVSAHPDRKKFCTLRMRVLDLAAAANRPITTMNQ